MVSKAVLGARDFLQRHYLTSHIQRVNQDAEIWDAFDYVNIVLGLIDGAFGALP